MNFAHRFDNALMLPIVNVGVITVEDRANTTDLMNDYADEVLFFRYLYAWSARSLDYKNKEK